MTKKNALKFDGKLDISHLNAIFKKSMMAAMQAASVSMVIDIKEAFKKINRINMPKVELLRREQDDLERPHENNYCSTQGCNNSVKGNKYKTCKYCRKKGRY